MGQQQRRRRSSGPDFEYQKWMGPATTYSPSTHDMFSDGEFDADEEEERTSSVRLPQVKFPHVEKREFVGTSYEWNQQGSPDPIPGYHQIPRKKKIRGGM